MLAAPVKKSKALDWSEPLRSYIYSHYSSSEVDKHSGSIQRLNNARERIISTNRIDEEIVGLVKNYLRMLGSVETRFPVNEHDMKVNFTWFDSFKPQKKFTNQKLTSEKASVLFNLAAMESYLGMQSDRTNADGLKAACTHFQTSAGIFELLRDKYVPERVAGPITTDLSQEGLSMLRALMLAQAQACFFEKAVRSKLAASVLTKLACQAQKYYTEALEYAASPALVGLDKSWAIHLEFQSRCFAASSEYQFSKVHLENAEKTSEGYGLRIAWLNSANKKCGLAIETARSSGLPESMLGTVLNLQKVLLKEYNKAVEDNNSIYMDRIPGEDELGAIPFTSLAKPLPVPEDLYLPIVPGTEEYEDPVFKGLLPAEMQEAEAIYQSKLSALLQKSANAVESSASNVRMRLAEANLPAAVEAGDNTKKGIPDSTWAKILENVQNRGGMNGLIVSLDQNAKTASLIASKIAEIERELHKEELEDSRYRQTWGERWTISPSTEINKHLKRDIVRYKGLLTEATESDNTLRRKIKEHSNLLDTVNMPKEGMDLLMPEPSAIDEDPKVEALRKELSILLVKLGTSVADSEKLQAQLVEAVSKDSIVPNLASSMYGVTEIVNNKQKLEEMMSDKISVHEGVVSEITRIIESHSAQLSRVLDKNHAFMASRNETDAIRKREDVISQLEGGVAAFSELYNHIQEGKKFYQDLSGLVNQLENTVKDHCFSRKLQQEEMEQYLVKSFEGGSGGPPPALTRQASIPAMSEYVSSAGLGPSTLTPSSKVVSASPVVRPVTNAFSQPPAIVPGVVPAYPTQANPGYSPNYQVPRVAAVPAVQPYPASVAPQARPQPVPQTNSLPAPQKNLSDEQAALDLAQQQIIEEQRQILMQLQNKHELSGPTGVPDEDYTSQIEQMKSILGNGLKQKELLPFIKGAGGDVQIAVNHYLEAKSGGGKKDNKKANEKKSKKKNEGFRW